MKLLWHEMPSVSHHCTRAASPRGLYFSSLLDALPSDAIVKIVPPGHSTRFELDGGMPHVYAVDYFL